MPVARRELPLVHRHASLLEQSLCRAVRCREPRRGQQLQRVEACGIRVARQRVARDLGEGRLGAQDAERRLAQGGRFQSAEEETGHLLRGAECFLAVHTAGHVARERLLGGALLRRGGRLRIE